MTIRFLSFRRIVFWVGATLAGLPSLLAPELSLLTRLLRALSMGLGLSGIVFIMLSATKRLEKKQAERAPSTWPVLKKDGTVRQQAAQTQHGAQTQNLPRTLSRTMFCMHPADVPRPGLVICVCTVRLVRGLRGPLWKAASQAPLKEQLL